MRFTTEMLQLAPGPAAAVGDGPKLKLARKPPPASQPDRLAVGIPPADARAAGGGPADLPDGTESEIEFIRHNGELAALATLLERGVVALEVIAASVESSRAAKLPLSVAANNAQVRQATAELSSPPPGRPSANLRDRPITDPALGFISLKGLGKAKLVALQAAFPTYGDLCRSATVETLTEIDGIGGKLAASIVDQIRLAGSASLHPPCTSATLPAGIAAHDPSTDGTTTEDSRTIDVRVTDGDIDGDH